MCFRSLNGYVDVDVLFLLRIDLGPGGAAAVAAVGAENWNVGAVRAVAAGIWNVGAGRAAAVAALAAVAAENWNVAGAPREAAVAGGPGGPGGTPVRRATTF